MHDCCRLLFKADRNYFAFCEAVFLNDFSWKFTCIIFFDHFKTYRSQFVEIVATVNAHMVVLPEYFRAFFFIGDGIVFEGFVARQVLRYLKYAKSAWFQHPIQLVHCFGVVGNVFEYMVAEYDIVAVVCKWKIADVGFYVGQWRISIGCSVIQIF